MDGSTPILEKEKDEAAMARVLEEARGYATNLSLRLANWWSAYMPLSKSLTDKPPESSQSTALENKKVETIRGSWYTNKELKKLSSSHRISSTREGDEESKILIWLLGKTYTITAQDFDPENDSSLNQLLDDFKSQPWFTYRHHFPQLKPASFTTDSGWGCMLRTGQCLLAQALIRHQLGKNWELKDIDEPANQERYIKLMELFLDDMSPRCPFSIHRIALLGKQLGNEIGEWFGPYTMAQVLSSLVKSYPETNLRVYVNVDGTLYKSSILQSEDQEAGFTPILILLPIRLGIDSFNPVYHTALKGYFNFPQIVGIAGGKPSSSFFFMGVEEDNLIYLDPHHSRPAIPLKEFSEWTTEDFSSFHCAQPQKLSISALDPCMLIGFYCSSQEDFLDLCARTEKQANLGTPIFTIMDTPPVYQDLDFDMESDNEFS